MRDLQITRHRYAAGTALRMDFGADREADGWTTAAQMFMILLLTDLGSVPSDPKRGTTFMRDLRSGRIYSDLLLKGAFEFAARDVFSYMAQKGYSPARGTSQLAEVRLVQWAVDTGKASLHVEMRSSDGDVIRYEMPARL